MALDYPNGSAASEAIAVAPWAAERVARAMHFYGMASRGGAGPSWLSLSAAQHHVLSRRGGVCVGVAGQLMVAAGRSGGECTTFVCICGRIVCVT